MTSSNAPTASSSSIPRVGHRWGPASRWVALALAGTLTAGCGDVASGDTAAAPLTSESPRGATTGPGPSQSPTSSPTGSPTVDAPASAPVTAAPQRPRPAARPAGRTVIVADSEYGPMLFGADGQPIYLFTAEPGARAACYDACAAAWPPVFTEARPRARQGARPSLLGTTRRRDGRLQVTYAGHPLYFYAHEGPYEVRCHDVEEFGGTWLVVGPDGEPRP